jgi:thiosulfate/3-mercaptopyruvate sulfurtransferase
MPDSNKYWHYRKTLTLKLVISPEELRSLKDVLIVDARPFGDYAKGHVPGAVNIDLMQFHWIDTSKEGIRQFNKQSKILLSNIGVSRKKFVVFYDDISGPSAARGVWLLLYSSHSKVAMLDGGLEGWKAKGYELEAKTNPFVHADFKGRPDAKILAGYETIKAAAKKKKTVVLDARSKEEYDGTAVRAARAGHIPNAVNIDWNDNVKSSAFKDEKDLGKMYAKMPKDAEVIT